MNNFLVLVQNCSTTLKQRIFALPARAVPVPFVLILRVLPATSALSLALCVVAD
jgi:hypothetical protein